MINLSIRYREQLHSKLGWSKRASTSGQLALKLIVTMMVTVLFSRELPPMMGRSENLDHDGPGFLHGTSDQLDPKLDIRAMMARISWPESKAKM